MEITQYLFESEVLQRRTWKKAAAKPQKRGKKRLGALKTLMHIHST